MDSTAHLPEIYRLNRRSAWTQPPICLKYIDSNADVHGLFLMLAITGEFTHKWDAAFSLGRQWLAAIPALLELGNTNLAGALQPAWGRASAFANLQTLLIYNSSVTGRLGRLCLI